MRYDSLFLKFHDTVHHPWLHRFYWYHFNVVRLTFGVTFFIKCFWTANLINCIFSDSIVFFSSNPTYGGMPNHTKDFWHRDFWWTVFPAYSFLNFSPKINFYVCVIARVLQILWIIHLRQSMYEVCSVCNQNMIFGTKTNLLFQTIHRYCLCKVAFARTICWSFAPVWSRCTLDEMNKGFHSGSFFIRQSLCASSPADKCVVTKMATTICFPALWFLWRCAANWCSLCQLLSTPIFSHLW